MLRYLLLFLKYYIYAFNSLSFLSTTFEATALEQMVHDAQDASASAKALCLGPGLTAYGRIWLGFAKTALLLQGPLN